MNARQIIEAEDPKAVFKRLPRNNFFVDAQWERWWVSDTGFVLTREIVTTAPQGVTWHNVKKFDVDAYRKRTGRFPSGMIRFRDISYWTHQGAYMMCRPDSTRIDRNESQQETEATADYPTDFQVLLFDYLQDMGIMQFPAQVRVRLVPLEPFLSQAQKMRYAPGDERGRAEYRSALTDYVRGGGKIPPIIIRGNLLLDGRHRLRALAGRSGQVRAIDLNDQ
jgi:hypothetical protein